VEQLTRLLSREAGPLGLRVDAVAPGVGGDGAFDVVLRAVDAPEPVLRAEEYRWLQQATEIGVLRVDGPELHFGAPEALRAGARIPVAPGAVKIQVFALEGPRDRHLVAVVCPAPHAGTDLRELPELW
jgi:NAD(P)-dependent dehydrogenase (short-subunit alcohol dehydrogenase family)